MRRIQRHHFSRESVEKEVNDGKKGWKGFLEEAEVQPGRQEQSEMVT